MWDTDNPFLNGPYAPWHEEGAAFDLEVEGEIPADLNGALYRVGPNQHYRPTNPDRLHWFDGDGMVHAVYLRDGRAQYRNRYVRTDGLSLEMREGQAIFGSGINGGTPLPDGHFPKNPANTNVALFNDRLLVYSEIDVPHQLRPDTLETTGRYDFHGGVSGPVCAHFKIDPDNGDLLFFGAMNGIMTWYRSDANGKVLDVHTFDMGVPTMIHDYVVTKDYAIFLISPTMARIANAFTGEPVFVWDPEALPASRFAVMNRRTGAVQWIEGDGPFTQTHFLNAYQDGQKVIVDGHRTERLGLPADQLDSFGADGDWVGWFANMVATPWRWELDLAASRLADRPHTDLLGEFPRINDAYAGRQHRFGYFATTRGVGDWFTDGLAKHDHALGRTDVHTPGGALTAPNEPVFVPREGGTAEDDGWLLSIWWDPGTDRSEVIVQNALDFTAAPVARIKLNHRVPLGFHGNWAPAADIEKALSGTTNLSGTD